MRTRETKPKCVCPLIILLDELTNRSSVQRLACLNIRGNLRATFVVVFIASQFPVGLIEHSQHLDEADRDEIFDCCWPKTVVGLQANRTGVETRIVLANLVSFDDHNL